MWGESTEEGGSLSLSLFSLFSYLSFSFLSVTVSFITSICLKQSFTVLFINIIHLYILRAVIHRCGLNVITYLLSSQRKYLCLYFIGLDDMR